VSRMTDRIANALKRFGAKRVAVREDDEDKGYFHAEMDALDPSDRQFIADAVARTNGLTVIGGGTLLAWKKGQRSVSDVTFQVKVKKGKGK
jgi:hypothetical protein